MAEAEAADVADKVLETLVSAELAVVVKQVRTAQSLMPFCCGAHGEKAIGGMTY